MDISKTREDVIAVLKAMDVPYEIDKTDIIKMNDLHLAGIILKQGNVGKTLYINDFAEADITAGEIAEQIITICETSTDVPPMDLFEGLTARQPVSDVADNLFVALVGDDRNGEYLEQVISRSVGNGLSFICQIRYYSSESFLSTTITKELAASNQWDVDELFDIAIQNTSEKDPATMFSMSDALFMDAKTDLLSDDAVISDEMLVLSNKSGMHGAAALFLPGIIDKILNKLKQAFFAIPSSIHEFLIIPESSGVTMTALRAMCRDANASVVRYNEVLSDNVLYIPYK